MSFAELYLWSQIMDVNPLLMFATGDPLTAWAIEEIFEPDVVQKSFQQLPPDQVDFSGFNPDAPYQEGDFQFIPEQQFADESLEQFLSENSDPTITDDQFVLDVLEKTWGWHLIEFFE